jgi:hypothetical protein
MARSRWRKFLFELPGNRQHADGLDQHPHRALYAKTYLVGRNPVTDCGQQAVIVVNGATNGEVELRYHSWAHNDLTVTARAPLAAGDPAGYTYDVDRTQHVVYRGTNGQIHELWYNADGGWGHNNLRCRDTALDRRGYTRARWPRRRAAESGALSWWTRTSWPGRNTCAIAGTPSPRSWR